MTGRGGAGSAARRRLQGGTEVERSQLLILIAI